MLFDPYCRRCPRLALHLDAVHLEYPGYHARPVPAFGDHEPRLLIVGLAPGLHGANRTGRPFTGDHAGILLYDTLHRFGFASIGVSTSADDGLRLIGCRITNAVKCLPPENKPETAEIDNCNNYLRNEFQVTSRLKLVLALGNIAHGAVLKAHELKRSAHAFGHGLRHELPGGLILFDSYHCSRYNTQTKRLTPEMFHSLFTRIRSELDG